MVTVKRKGLSVEVDSALLDGLRYIAATEGREFREILEEAMSAYLVQQSGIESNRYDREITPHLHAVIAKYRKLHRRVSE